MYMIVCDVEGCDSVENDQERGLMGRQLPDGWKTLQMNVPPSAEEAAEIERQQEEIKRMLETTRAASVVADAEPIDVGFMMPVPAERSGTFVMCPKHQMPTMKAGAAAPSHVLGPAIRRRPFATKTH